MEEAGKKEPVNLLSLDGGGVRGVSSLLILHAIMTEIKKAQNLDVLPKPCEYFHLIAGTSTGGLIAIMLGRLRMSTKEALDAYDEFAARIFCKENRKKYRLSDKYFATPLKEIVQGIVKDRGLGELMWDPEQPEKGKAMVCVMPLQNVGNARVIRTFPGDEGIDDQWDRNILIWEAARATTAAPTFFKPQVIGGEAYVDGALGANNPVDYLLREAIQEFGSWRRLGCVVSIGTGTREVGLSDGPLEQRRAFMVAGKIMRLVRVMKATLTDSETEHQRLSARLGSSPGAYFRFNVPQAAEKIALDNYLQIPELKTMTSEYLREVDVAVQVQAVAKGLNEGFRHGFTLGLIREIDTEQVILSNAPINALGTSSPFFTGREDILSKLDRLFSLRDTKGYPRRECLLYGMGGVGKTEIARKAAEMFRTRFQYIFFIDGSTPSSICLDYANICRKYDLGNGDPQGMQQLAIAWIEKLTEEWLMIFDDCDMSNRTHHLPPGGTGNIIYTSRLMDLQYGLPAECVFEIKPLSETESVQLLLKASGSQSIRTSSDDAVLAQQLVKEVEYLPSGITYAAAVIRDGRSLSSYLEDIRARKVSILRDPRFQGKSIEKTTVYATLELSYESLQARRRRYGRGATGRSAMVALKVLGLLCFYHHKEFPIATFGRAARERHKRNAHLGYPLSKIMDPPDADFDFMLDVNPDGSWDPNWVAVGLRILESFSLVKRDRERSTVSMHALVHEWATLRMDEDQSQRYALVAKIILCESVELSWRWLDQAFARSLGPHASLGWLHELSKNFDAAEKAYFVCLREWKAEAVERCGNSWGVINTLQRLGTLYHDMGRLGDAEMTYLETVERLCIMIMEREASRVENPSKQEGDEENTVTGADHSLTDPSGDTKTVVETVSRQLSWSAFSRHLRRHRQATSSSQAPGVPFKPYSVAMQTSEEESDFEDITEELVQLWIHFYIIHGYLARVYIDQDRFGTGRRMLVEVAEYLGELLPADHVELLRVQNEAKSLTDPGDLKFWNKRINDWWDLADGPGNEYWESDAGWQLVVFFADCQLKNGMYDKAYEQYDAALKLFERMYGPYDKKVLNILHRMVICKAEDDDCDKAVEIARDCLQRARRGYSECHKETVLAMEKLYEACFFQKLEQGFEEETILREAVVRAEEALGLTHSITRRLRMRLGCVKREGKKPAPPPPPRYDIRQSGIQTLEKAWQTSRHELEKMKAQFGEHHLLVRRFARFVGDAPAKTREEFTRKLLACFGPNTSVSQTCLRELQRERDELAASKNSHCEPDGIYFCSCGEQEHAGSSWERELQEREEVELAQEIEEAVANEVSQEAVLTSSDDPDRTVKRWQNEPYFFCGLF
ncbi:hypothetical protein VTJ49DRAFT_7264 [Mycothermus thermophilus]|uniref:PNPLA domain-containing protein n=1 Tax=Humicola insolens TaxID=85995 RepID=A0ABR3VI72_HUMIN